MNTLKSVQRIASKKYRCEFCGGLINKGESYIDSTIADGEIYSFKNHIKCEEYSKRIRTTDGVITKDDFKYQLEEDKETYNIESDNYYELVSKILKIEESL